MAHLTETGARPWGAAAHPAPAFPWPARPGAGGGCVSPYPACPASGTGHGLALSGWCWLGTVEPGGRQPGGVDPATVPALPSWPDGYTLVAESMLVGLSRVPSPRDPGLALQ